MRKSFLLAFLLILVSRISYSQGTITLTGYPIVTTGWTIENSASAVDSEIVLTTASGSEEGEAIYGTEEDLTACGQFTVDFDWQITSAGGISVADGIAFFFINPLTGIGAGGGLGLPEPETGFLLTFDTYDNDGDGLNPENEMFGFTTATTYSESLRTPLLCSINGHNGIIDDGSWHHCRISYNGGSIKVYWDYSSTVAMSGTFPITTPGYFGFSAGTGGGWSKQSVKRVVISYNTISAIVGPTTYCVGSTSSLGDSTTGGTWVSSNTSVATIGSSSGSITALSLGTSIITYTYNSGACSTTTTINVVTPPASIAGIDSMCNFSSTTLTDATSGGTWISSRTTVATVGTSSGTVTGVSAGSATITYSMGGACYVTAPMTIFASPAPMTGTNVVCTGFTTTLIDTVSGGTWSSTSTGIATVGTTGVVSGVSAGTSVISYTFGGFCVATSTVTVNQSPPAITGTPYLCPGTTTDLSDAMSGGTWISNHTSVATVGSSTGIVSGVAAGTATISYKLTTTGCYADETVTVNPLPFPISGITVFCAGATSLLTDATSGGTWSSGSTAIATVGSSGIVTGVSAGTAIITYKLNTGCISIATVTINPLPGAIFGTPNVCPGFTSTLADDTTGGTWSSSDFTIASIGSTTGVVTGVAAGTVSITYTLGATGCLAITSFTVNPTPPAISGVTSICLGYTTTLSDLTSGGTWSTSSVTTAPVGATTGVVTGLSIGLPTITYTLPTGCYNTVGVTVYPNPAAIGGTTTLCVGNSSTLTDATPTGTWSSSNTAVAPVVSSLGLVTGSSAGTAIITYMLSTGCYVITTVTVLPAPSAISGPTSVCTGTTVTLTDGIGGGTWTSSHTTVATIGSSTGIVTGVSVGSTVITYSLGGTCRSTRVETVVASPSGITGTPSICAGATTTLSDGTGGGTWSSGSTGIATVGTSGIVTGVSSGTAVITYKIGDGCMATDTVAVYLTPTAIGGILSVCLGASSSLTDLVSGGTWSSSNTAVATIGSSSGIADGVSVGTAVITYMIGSCRATATITVNPLPASITGSLGVCAGATTTLGDITTVGTWSSGSTTVATVGTGTGIVAGISPGTSIITYKLPTGCINTATVTVSSAPAAITGANSLCSGTTTLLGDITGGGGWSSSNTTVATVDSTTGLVDGVSAGTAVITYSLGGSCNAMKTVTVYAAPAAPGGPHALCVGTTITLSDIVGGGTWVSGSTGVATIGATSGVVTGIALGTTIVTYTAPGGCSVEDTISVSPTPTGILGPDPVCTGTPVSYSDAVSGGLWTSSNTAVVTVGSLTGIVTGVLAGTATITYSLGSGCTAYKSVTVITSPLGITGTTSICVGATTTLADGTGGGTWSSGNTAVATVSATGGVVSGVSAGTAIISYTVASGCFATTTVTVSPTPSAITGIFGLCQGASTLLGDGVPGGTWSSSNTAVATVGSTGTFTGVSAGTAVISYTLGGSCSATRTVTVYASPTAIIGPTALCVGATMTLSDGVGGGTWVSGSTAVATVGLSTGLVTGISLGTTVITYTVAGGCSTTTTIAVSPTPTGITGIIPLCAGSSITLGDGVPGGGWVSSNTAVATIGSLTGIVTGIASGTSIITYSLGSGCTASATVTVLSSPVGITGPGAVCIGAVIDLSDVTPLGTWASSSGAVATVGASSGIVDGISAGTVTITYTIGDGCMALKTITVSPLPSVITGTLNVCVGSTTSLSDITGGGTWASGSTSIATVGSTSGTVSGISAGNSVITYILPGGCFITTTVTVNPTPAVIGGTTSLCAGTTTTLTDGTGGGTWTSGTVSVATIVSTSGFLDGIASGTSVITYKLAAGCTATTTVTVNAVPAEITGTLSVCVGSTTDLSDLTGGGTWASGSTSVASVGLASGIVSGISAGNAVITYILPGGCYTTATVTVNAAPPAIGGTTSLCAGATTILTDVTGGGTWSSSNTAVGTITGTSGIVEGITSGSTIITYTLSDGCTATATVTVKASPDPITGSTNMCVSTTIIYSDLVSGGAWTSSNAAVATIGIGSGSVFGVSIGTTIITYTLSSGCYVTQLLTVNPSATAIVMPAHVCTGSCYTLTDAVSGGTWVSTNVADATIGSSSGLLCGVAAGSTTITYSLGAGCTAWATVAVNIPPAGITGTLALCQGTTTTLSDVTIPGTWTSGSTVVATVGAGTGIVAGVSGGTAMITFVIADGCTATAEVTVNPVAAITGPAAICQGQTATMADAVPGGTWESSDATVASIDISAGTVTGMSSGSSVITYTTPGGCTVTKTITVNPIPDPITGIADVCIGQTTDLSDLTGSVTWSSGSTAVATVGVSSGIVSGITAGTVIITCRLATGCQVTDTITVNPLPGAISGSRNLCAGATTDLSDGGTGSWSGSNALIATIGSSSGVVSGLSAGTEVITYTVGSGCIVTTTITVYPTPSAIMGTDHLCVGQSTGLTDAYPGGTWSSSASATASIGVTTGVVDGVVAGTATISYTLAGTGCAATLPFTVISLPGVIGGTAPLCDGATETLTDPTSGGAWSSSDTSIATIDGSSGAATGMSSGTVLISYTLGTGCMAISSIIINPLSPVDGPSTVCAGQTILVSDTTTGGTWSSSATSIATVFSAGDTTALVSGILAGTATIYYTLPTGCTAAKVITVAPSPDAIFGPSEVCVLQTIALTDGTTGGAWSSSATGVATVSGGIVTGVMEGTTEISYTAGSCPATKTVTVNPLPAAIAGNTGVCLGTTTSLTDATSGGAWSSSTTVIASVSGVGVVTGWATGTAIITYRLGTGCIAADTINVNPAPGAISGSVNFCVGYTDTLSDGTTGGTWGSSATSIATVSSAGVVTGVSAGSAIITYALGTGCEATTTVNVYSLPPAISGSPQVCVGSTDTLSDAAAGGAWISGSTSVATVTSGTGVVTGIAAGTTAITYTLGAGCTVTAAITVNPPPMAIAGTPLQLCQGASATVYDASSPGTWSSLNPTIATVDATSGLVTGINAGSTIITYTLLTTGCTAEGTVTVFAQPTVFTGNLTICLGTTSDLSESVSGGAWYSLEPTVATVTSASAGSIGEVFGASLGTAEISYILGAGCSMQATVEVVPLPGAFAVTGGGNFCADSAGVDVGLAGSGTGTNYLLYRGSTALGAFAGTGYPINFGRQTVGGIYTVEAINTTTGCTNLMSGSANVIVIPTVTPAVGIASGSGDTVCAGASVTYTALPVNGGTGPAYQWNVNGVNVGTGGIYTYIPAAGDVVKVTLTSDASCPLPDTASHELTMDVEALQNPLVSFSASPGDTVCNGMAVTLTASPVYGGATPAFTWKKDGAVIGSGPVFTYVPANGDMITCFMTSDYLCLVTDTVTGPAMVMTVDNPIIPTVTISANPGTTVGIGKSATLTAEVTNGGTDPTYQWYINGVPVPGATAQSFTKSNFDTLFEDSVSVVVTSSGVCPMSTHNWVYIQVSDVGVRNIQGGSDISVLPNPSKGTFTIKGTVGAGNEEVTVEVTDLLGQSVYQTKISAQGGRINEQVTLGNNIANGMYILNLHTDTDNMVFHIVVEQ